MCLLTYKTAFKSQRGSKSTAWRVCFILLASFFITGTSYAEKQRDAELVAFYNQVFNKNTPSQKLTKTSEKSVIKKNKHLRNQHKSKELIKKDAQLVAAYNQIFGISQTKNRVFVPKNPQVVNNRVVQPSKNFKKPNFQLKVNNKVMHPAVIDQKVIKKKSQSVSKTTVKDNSTVSQTTNIDALFEKAFGKKKASPEVDEDPPSNGNNADLSALFAKAFGQKSMVRAPPQVSVDFRINKEVIGEIIVFSNKSGFIDQTDKETVLELLKEVLKEHIFKRVEEELTANEHVLFKKLTSLGLKTAYNSVNLSLDLIIKPELRKPRVLSMQSRRKASVRDENKITASEISGFLNLYSNLDVDSNNNKPRVRMKFEGSLNIGRSVLESTVDFRNDKFTHNKTVLTYDKPDKLQRFQLGNVSTGNRNFQENLELNGFRISKEFFMEPELQIRPRANESFVLDSDSEVEVYINNKLRQRFYLEEGVYSLEDIGLYEGENNIRVRIKDEFGKVTIKTSQQFYDSHLLKPGLSFYAFSVGYLSNQQARSSEQLKDKLLVSGYYQKGISKNLTLSLDTQISEDSYLLGAEAITSIEFGSVKSSLGLSGGRDKDLGFATRFEFKPNQSRPQIGLDTLREDMLGLDTSVSRFLNSWTVSGEYRGSDFSLLNASDSFDFDSQVSKSRLKSRLQTNFSLKLPDNWRSSMNVGVADYYDASNNIFTNLTATKRFNNGTLLSVGARYDSNDDFSTNLQISIPLFKDRNKRRKNLDFLADSKNNSLKSKLSVKPKSLIGRNSLGGSLEYAQDDKSRQQNLDLSYRGDTFETSLIARNSQSLNDKDDLQRLNIGFNTSLACVGSNCARSNPIDDSFALVSGPINQNGPIAINNGNQKFRYSGGDNDNLPDNYIALIPNKGTNAVVNLESYRYQSINIDESTLPNGYDTEKTEFEVFPRYHQGFVIKAGGEPSTILAGNFVSNENKPLGFKGGQLVPINESGKTIAFFSNKAGIFRIISVPAGNYKLHLFDYPDMQDIAVKVPDLKGQVHDLGKLIITE